MSVELREVGVASLGVDKSSSTPVVILKEKAGDRLLPIWIGPGEASAIALVAIVLTAVTGAAAACRIARP